MNLPLPSELLPLLAERLGWALLHSLWQGVLIAAVLAIVLPFLRSAAARHATCLLALLGLAVAVTATFARGRPARLFSSTSATELADAPAPETPPVVPAGIAQTSRAHPANAAAARPSLPAWREHFEPMVPRLSWAWIFGVALLSLRHLLGWQRVRAMRRSGVAARPELQRTFAGLLEKFGCTLGTSLLESAHVAVPMLAGLVKPAVLLPLRVVTGLRACEIEAILAHEVAHLVRRDAWSNLGQVAIETLLFYHPAVWWISRRARQERENAADDLALAVCADRRVYAGALAQLAELECSSSAALAATGGSLLERIQRIVRPEPFETPGGAWSLCLVPLLAALALALTCISPAEAQTPKPDAATLKQATEKSEALLKPWLADAFQLDDAAKREAAIERIRTALRSTDADEARAGVTAFGRIASIEFDKASFRPDVRRLLDSPDAATRAAAVSAIPITGAEPADLERILTLADDPAPEVRRPLSWVLMRLHKADLTGRAGDAVLKLLSSSDRSDLREALRGIWGGKLSPALEARVIELSRPLETSKDVGYDAMYFALSTQANKSEASVRRLLELLAHQDTYNVGGRCAWGLQQGVNRAQYPLVAETMVKVIEARSDEYLRGNALRCLRAYGDAAQTPALRALLAKPGITAEFRKVLTETLAALEPRSATPAASPSPNAPPTPAPNETAEIEVEWSGKWWPATVLKRDGERTQIHYIGYGSEWDEWVTPARMRALQPGGGARAAVERNQQAARQRAAEDRHHYTPEQLQEIETLYQVANTKGKRTPEAVASLKQLLAKYDRANRTGCATLYLGQASEGAERLEYLTRAVEKFSDCYYFNGCQVGGYGRYVLALTLAENGERDRARALLEQLKTTYKDATDHSGQPMTTAADALLSKWAAEK